MSAPAVPALLRSARAAGPRPRPPLAAVPAAAAVLTQIAYPLLDGTALRAATVVSVVLFAAASATDAASRWGARAAVLLVAGAGGLGLAAESVGVATGFPFGSYSYADTLGPRLLGVPVVVPLAWTMMAYPCLLLGRRLTAGVRGPGPARRAAVALTGGVALASWDLYLDPQMVAEGHWTWAFPEPGLPGIPGIPLTNYAGWVLVAVTMTALLDRLLPAGPARGRGEAVPAALLAWTWLGSFVGNLVFFGRPWVALWGVAVMGLFVGPYLLVLSRRERATA